MKAIHATLFAATVAITAGLVSCDAKEEEKKEETKITDTSAAGTNLGKVKDNFIPASLKKNSSSSSLALSGDPCAGTDGFFDCQPKLLKLYLSFGQNMVDTVATLVPHLGTFMKSKTVGDKGSQDLTDAGNTKKISYNVISADSYEATMHTSKGPFLYIKVAKDSDGNDTYDLKVNLENDAEREEGSKDMTRVAGTITYTSETDFSVNVKMGGGECDADDHRSPSYINIYMNKKDAVSKGKAMLYMPRWLASSSEKCDATVSAATELYMYTDFAGNATNATGSLYMAKSELSDTADLGDYDIEDFCTNFASACSGGKFGGSGGVIADDYKNAFCTTSSDGITWDGACTGIPVTDYSASTLWRLPTDLNTDKSDLVGTTLPTEF